MKTVIETAIKSLASQIAPNSKPDDAMKYAQAALNLAHVLGTLEGVRASLVLNPGNTADGGALERGKSE